jgi:hypothetical protein
MPAATPEDQKGLSFFAGRADRGLPIRTKAAIDGDVIERICRSLTSQEVHLRRRAAHAG